LSLAQFLNVFHGNTGSVGKGGQRVKTVETRISPSVRGVSSETVSLRRHTLTSTLDWTELQIVQNDLIQKRRQARIAQPDFIVERIEF
jgi:hypothetical protein